MTKNQAIILVMVFILVTVTDPHPHPNTGDQCQNLMYFVHDAEHGSASSTLKSALVFRILVNFYGLHVTAVLGTLSRSSRAM